MQGSLLQCPCNFCNVLSATCTARSLLSLEVSVAGSFSQWNRPAANGEAGDELLDDAEAAAETRWVASAVEAALQTEDLPPPWANVTIPLRFMVDEGRCVFNQVLVGTEGQPTL